MLAQCAAGGRGSHQHEGNKEVRRQACRRVVQRVPQCCNGACGGRRRARKERSAADSRPHGREIWRRRGDASDPARRPAKNAGHEPRPPLAAFAASEGCRHRIRRCASERPGPSIQDAQVTLGAGGRFVAARIGPVCEQMARTQRWRRVVGASEAPQEARGEGRDRGGGTLCVSLLRANDAAQLGLAAQHHAGHSQHHGLDGGPAERLGG
mmetsp:Transcript_89150/g.268080  ORF Transcript_89150/g.268080 Transcript_89150/m.268080 type:complete len:210 (+) Transcript_89150:839-1468(+)